MSINAKEVLKPVRTKMDYVRTIKIIESLMDAKPGSEEESLLEILSILAEKYEETHFPIPNPDPVEAIKFRLEQQGMTQKDLGAIIGINRASEIFSRKRELSIDMMRKLHKSLSIPAETLLGVK